MIKRRTFHQDIRRKLIFFGLVPMVLIGALGALLIYQSEESLMISEHTRLLKTAEYLSRDYYHHMERFFKVVRTKIERGELSVVREGFDFEPDFHELIVLDRRGQVEQTLCRHACTPATYRLDAHQKELIRLLQQEGNRSREAVYYSPTQKRVLLTHAFSHKGKLYLIHANIEPLFDRIAHFIQRKTFRSIAIVNSWGVYIYDSRDPSRVTQERSFYQEGAYYAAVKGHGSYQVIEYPAHYQQGDSFWAGLWDEDNFMSHTHVPDLDWTVLVLDQGDTLDSYLKQVIFAAIILLVITMLLTIISANMMARNIITPVEKLIKSINAFARGKPMEEEQESITTYPIFENLLRSFNIMRSRIIAREKKLHEQVEENMRMQDHLLQQEKLAAMGEMIGNIAHQWRQPLSVVSTLATGLQTEQELGLASPERVHEVCAQINDNAQYLSGTIDDFRQFIKGDNQKADFKASELTESLMRLMQGQLKRHNIEIEIEIDETLVIHGYRNDLLQVLINLIGNAKDALVENQHENRLIRIAIGTRSDGAIEIHVIDNGGGIDPKIINRIFEPYFTTKHKAQGTGLGLHMVHRLIVEGMGGTITAETTTVHYQGHDDRGAAFTIILPQEADTPSSEKTTSGKTTQENA